MDYSSIYLLMLYWNVFKLSDQHRKLLKACSEITRPISPDMEILVSLIHSFPQQDPTEQFIELSLHIYRILIQVRFTSKLSKNSDKLGLSCDKLVCEESWITQE